MTVELALTKRLGVLGELPPKKLTRRLLMLTGRRPKGAGLHIATAIAHLAYGAGTGALYALFPRSIRGPLGGSSYGIAVWAASYMGWIPKLGIMPPPSKDRPGRPTAMVLAHVLFGFTLDGTVRRLQS
jgi:hypothetical protein